MNQVQSPYSVVTRSPQDQELQEGPKKVLEELLQGSPAPHRSHEPDMPILDSLETSPTSRKLRESLDSHEDELLEDLATFDEELTNEVDESVVNLANDLIGKIEEQDFDEDDFDARYDKIISVSGIEKNKFRQTSLIHDFSVNLIHGKI